MDSHARVISLMLLLSITQFDDPFRVADGFKITESSILLNAQKGGNIISKLIDKFRAKKTGEQQIYTYPEVQSVPSSYTYLMPAQENVQAPYQYYYLTYQPTAVLPYEKTFETAPSPQQTLYTNSQFWSSVSKEKGSNVDKNVNINKDLSVSSHKGVTSPQLSTSIRGKDHDSPIYSTSIVINNEPKQVVPPQPAPHPSDTTTGCNGNCHQHISLNHHDNTPYPNNGNSQLNPPHLPSIYPVPPSPAYTNPPTFAYPAPAPPRISPTINHDSHYDVNIARVPENIENDRYFPIHAISQPPAYPVPVPPVTPPIYSHDSRFNANIPIIPENRETNRNPISPNRQPIYTQMDFRPRPPFIQHQNPPHIQQGQSYSPHSSSHHQHIYEASRQSTLANEYPQTSYGNYEPIPSELGMPNRQGQPKNIEREKTSTVFMETQLEPDIPDTSLKYRFRELPSKIEEGFRLVPVTSGIVERPPVHYAGGEVREKDQFNRSGTYVIPQERPVMPQVTSVNSSLSFNKSFDVAKSKLFSIPDKKFRS